MESRGDLALYEYLYRCIRHDIAHGKVEPGQKLPSKRALAKQLGVSLITIEAAYDQLVAEGYIRSRERCGYYACDLAPAAKIEEQGNVRFRTATETRANRRREGHASNPNGPQPLSQNEEHLERRTGYRPSDADFGPAAQRPCAPRSKRPVRCAAARRLHAQHAGNHHAPLLRLGESRPPNALGRISGIAGRSRFRSGLARASKRHRRSFAAVSRNGRVAWPGGHRRRVANVIPAACAAARTHKALRSGRSGISPAHAHVRAAGCAGGAYRAGRFRHRRRMRWRLPAHRSPTSCRRTSSPPGS